MYSNGKKRRSKIKLIMRPRFFFSLLKVVTSFYNCSILVVMSCCFINIYPISPFTWPSINHIQNGVKDIRHFSFYYYGLSSIYLSSNCSIEQTFSSFISSAFYSNLFTIIYNVQIFGGCSLHSSILINKNLTYLGESIYSSIMYP